MNQSLPTSNDDNNGFSDDFRGDSEVSEHSSMTESPLITSLREDILEHFRKLQLPALNGGETGSLSKEDIRAGHSYQRAEVLNREWKALRRYSKELLQNFANGSEVKPKNIKPILIPVISGKWTGNLFRFASLLWSVPVSRGYGRRMRFLVQDQQNEKLIGIFALGDPVFNLRCRDRWIGWDVNDRRERLVHLMDAYVVGAVPPYNQLLGGKLVTSLIGSAEVSHAFTERYSHTTGIISKKQKEAKLILVTVTSALGRSSMYNRVRLQDPYGAPIVNLERIGETRGYGHFQLSNDLFERIRGLLIEENHPYAYGHEYGEGPNWRFRVIRVGLKKLGLDEELIRHGINREVFAMPMHPEFKSYLCGQTSEITLSRPSLGEISAAALERWILPRAMRMPKFQEVKRDDIFRLIGVPEDQVSISENKIMSQKEFQIPFPALEEVNEDVDT